jgi:maltose/maltodextrin transport system permease protein
MKPSPIKIILAHAILILLVIVMAFPLLMVVSISLRPGNLAGGSLIPQAISFEHWRFVLGIDPGPPVLRWLVNSLLVSGLSSLLVVILSTSAAYAFARLRFALKGHILDGLLILQMFPSVVAIIAMYGLLDAVGRFVPGLGLNTHGGLIMAYLGGVATHIWMIRGYFQTIPDSIEEAALIDGATPFQTFVRVLLPMSVPALVVTFILAFIGTIGEYPLASVVLQNTERWTLAVGANSFLYPQNYQWGRFAATAVLTGVPISIVFLICQKFLVSGLTSGASKE